MPLSGDEVHFELVSGKDRKTALEAIGRAISGLATLSDEPRERCAMPLLLLRKEDEASKKAMARRVHDIRGALRTLSLALESIKQGYRFDDPIAEAKLNAMDKALAVLVRECQIPLTVLSSE